MGTKPSPTPLTYVWLDYGVATHSGPAGMFYRGSEQVPFCVRKDQLGFTEKEFLDEVCRAVNHHEKLVKALKLLYDNQNGPPLQKYEREWNEAMRQASALLSELEQEAQ